MPPGGEAAYRGLAAAVALGGTLLVVGHDFSDTETTLGRWRMPQAYFTAEEMAATLDAEEWEILVAEARPGQAVDPDGREITVHDAVLRARRRH